VLNQLVALLLAEKAGVGFARDEAALLELDRAVHAAAMAAADATPPPSVESLNEKGPAIRKEEDHA
jgi:hypothetical protein